jgi:heme exporter protein A
VRAPLSAALRAEPEAVEPVGAVPALEAVELRRTFAGRRAVDGVSFALHGGECLALFGPNGAGKSTVLRMLAGLLRPTGGHAAVNGITLPGGAEARRQVGLLSHQSLLYDALSALENVEFAARLYGLREPEAAAREALARMRIADRASTPVRLLSRGLQQRVSVARATVHAPRVVLLDEPYTGLDEAGAMALTGLLEELLRSGAALVLVTHHLGEGLALATRALVMRAGRVVRDDARASIDPAAYAAEYRALVTGGGAGG